MTSRKPTTTEYDPFYATYVNAVPDGSIVDTLERQEDRLRSALIDLPDEKQSVQYAQGKWTVRQLVGHLADAERVFGYRALRISRGDATPLAGFSQDPYVEAGDFDDRAWSDLVGELLALRRANVHMFRSLTALAWERQGSASEAAITVRALAWIIAGHVEHHVRILSERYDITI